MAIELQRTNSHPLQGLLASLMQRKEQPSAPMFQQDQPLETPPEGQIPLPGLAVPQTAAEKYAPMAQVPPVAPQNPLDGLGQGMSVPTALDGQMRSRIADDGDGQTRDRIVPGMPVSPPARQNLRPELHGNSLEDWQLYNDQAQAYKAEDHNGRLRSTFAQGLRGLADAMRANGNDPWAGLGGLGAGLVAGGVDPSQDEFYYNEHYAKPRAQEGLGRAENAEKTRQGMETADANEEYRRQQTRNLTNRPQQEAVKNSVKTLQHYRKGENVEYDQWLSDNGYQLLDFDKRNGGKPVVIDSAGHKYVLDLDTNTPTDLGLVDKSKVPNEAGLLPRDEMVRIEQEANRTSRESEGAANRSSRERIASSAEAGRNSRNASNESGRNTRAAGRSLEGNGVPRSKVIARAKRILASDPNGEMTYTQAYTQAVNEVRLRKGTIVDDPAEDQPQGQLAPALPLK